MNPGANTRNGCKNRRGIARAGKSFPVLTWLLLVCMACSVPSIGPGGVTTTPPSETPTTEAPQTSSDDPEAEPTQVVVQLPPDLVEVSPPQNTNLVPNISPLFYFNQPMDRASVEGAVELAPVLAARFEWLDDATMRLVPEQPASLETDLRVVISTDARAANGISLTEPIQVSYQAPEALKVAQRLPEPGATEVNPSSAVAVTFNRPVIALGADPAESLPAFTIEPVTGSAQPAGRGEWLNTSTYIFYPQPPLFGGSQYNVQLNPALAAFDGSTLLPNDSDGEWSFATAAPILLSLQPAAAQLVELDDAFVLTFNQAMETSSVEESFSLVRPDGTLVAGTFSWNEAGSEVTFKPSALLDRSTVYGMVLYGSARSQGGATLGQDFAASLATVPQFGVTQTSPSTGETLNVDYGQGVFTLTFSSPVAAEQDLNRLIRFSPAVSGQLVNRSLDGYQIFVSGFFQPSTSYTLEIAPDLVDRWNATLGLPYTFIFSTSAARPSLVIPIRQAVGQAMFVPYGETNIPAESVNIERLALASGEVSLEDFILAGQNWQGLQNWEPMIRSRWVSLLYPDPNVTENIDVPIHPTGDLLAPGLYVFKVDTTPVIEGADTSPALLVVSPIELVLKTSLRQAFVWAVRIADHQPVEGAKIDIYNQLARVVASCETDAQGACQVDLPPVEDPDLAYYAVIGQPGDPDFSLAAYQWFEGVAPWGFNIGYQRESADPEVYLYTDRPIYRPGQAVNLRAVLRDQENGRYSLSELKELTLDVISPYDPMTSQSTVLTSLRLSLDAYGTGAGVYTLPENARPGQYILRVHDVKYKEISFSVAEYRKPEIDLRVAFSQPDQLIGEDIQANVQASYFFGAPASNTTVRWTLFGERATPTLPNGLVFGRVDTSWMNSWEISGVMGYFVTEGQATTQPDGSLVIEISGALLRERLETFSGNPLRLTLEVTVEDESGLPVSGRDQMNLNPSPYFIGVRPEDWSISAGEEITYTIQTVDWQGNSLSDRGLFARFSKVTWQAQENDIQFAPPEYVMEAVEVGSTEFRTSENGEARLAFLPNEPGTFMVEITGEEGAITQALIWVGGVGSPTWPNLPNQRLLLRSDATQYAPGDQAKIFIPNPFDDTAVALITVERAKVMRFEVLEIEGSSTELDLPLIADDAPNIYVSVTLLGRTAGRPDFRVGYLNLDVQPDSNFLQLQVQFSPPNPQPGQDVTVTLRARDAGGDPVQAAVSLALVDKAVLALADPNSESIEEAFYGRQYLGVQTGYALAAYAGRSLYIPPGRGGGGGGAELQTQPGVREEFEDTAYWNGSLETDVTGVAQAVVRLPDNLTTWQADVRGLTMETLVGGTRADLLISKPLLVRPITPRFVVQGDHLELAAVVHNNTADPVQASVRLDGAGFGLDDLNQAVQVINLAAGEGGRVSWWGTVQDVDSLDLVFRAEAGALQDAARPEMGPLPVKRYYEIQVFGTSGVLAEEGVRQELVSLPRSFSPTGGNLRIEISPSLSATILAGLPALDEFPRDFTEPVISRLLPNLLVYSALRDSQLGDETLLSEMERVVGNSVDQLVLEQNEDGGWGWAAGASSSPYLSSYVLLGLARAYQMGVFVDPGVIQKGQAYLIASLIDPGSQTASWQLDQLAFQYFVLQQSGGVDLDAAGLYSLQEKLSPWGKAFLALALDGIKPDDSDAQALISDLQASASRTATGASWQDPNPGWYSWSTPNFTTAVVAYAIARLDPASQVLPDAVRFLVVNRRPNGGWNSSYESAWALLALVETAQATGDLQASYDFSASLNGSPLMTGTVENPAAAIRSTSTQVDLPGLRSSLPNELEIQHGEGSGSLYYRAYLEVSRPAESVPAQDRGMSVAREYFQAGQDCSRQACQPLQTVSLADPQPLLVRLVLTIPEDMYYVVVEDQIPAGVEILNPRLKTAQQNDPSIEQVEPYQPENPFSRGWGWWLFQDPQVFDDRVRWVVDFLPAGTYQLTYRITPFLAGEFRVLPAHAYQNYFPEVEGSSAGAVLTIQ